jgi:hypothetical protein
MSLPCPNKQGKTAHRNGTRLAITRYHDYISRKKFITNCSQSGTMRHKNVYDFAKLISSILTLVTKLHKMKSSYPHKRVNRYAELVGKQATPT